MLETKCVPEVSAAPPIKVARYEALRPAQRRSVTRGERDARRRMSTLAKAGRGAPVVVGDDGKQWWEQVTQDLVQISTVPFVVLLMPQVVRNAINMASGNLTALSILSWMGFVTSLLGNTLLLSYFVSKGERGAALIQAIGVASNIVMLAQICLAGYLQASVFWTTATFTAVSCFFNSAYVMGALNAMAWGLWENFLGIIGLGVLVQVLWSTFGPVQSILPGVGAGSSALVLSILDRRGYLSSDLKDIWGGLSAWTATLLFGFQPVGQLVRNFMDPSSLQGLSMGTILLAMAGNGLMVPRALRTRDKIWLTGTLWGSLLMGWAQLLSMHLGSFSTGLQYMRPVTFYLVSVIVAFYFAAVFTIDSRMAGLPSPWSSFLQTYRGR
ncbi:hypothetical protein BSKO_07379 [Bryopsis sp. KO-2023]|nr:hypothetical protein BSKO_07379 [Bryopsis sp. KO-2023]